MKKCSIAVSVLASLLGGGCATTGVGGGGFDGDYRGQGVLDMTIATPVYRQLPTETTQALVSLRAAGNGRAIVVVRFRARGNQCTLQASIVSGGFYVDPGQVCRGLIAYDQYDIDAMLQITDARGNVAGGSLAMAIAGNVIADHADGSRNTGVARWQMSGTR
ncbi:MAG: hypothetical protein U0324_44655 [Polyangiales bacterium]